jgi:hypothetical protein
MNHLEFLIPIVMFICIAASIKFIVDSRLRRRLAETHSSEDLVRAMLVTDEQTRRLSALKWGIVLVGVGVAFAAIDALNLNPDRPLTWGLLLIAGGAGMLGFHKISTKKA